LYKNPRLKIKSSLAPFYDYLLLYDKTGDILMKKTLITFTVILASLLTSNVVHAKREHPENFYQKQWCQEHNGELEVTMKDGTRCDCVTETHAVEVDFADNWYAAVGQSTHYSIQTGKPAGIVLILESPDDKRHLDRLINLVDKSALSINVWTVGINLGLPQPYPPIILPPPPPLLPPNDCQDQEPPTIEMEKTGSSVKWLIRIPCLVDKTGTFVEPMWATFGSKQREDGDLLFGVDDYGQVE
jgi:hypothetical protein